jgi:hypothetical protein
MKPLNEGTTLFIPLIVIRWNILALGPHTATRGDNASIGLMRVYASLEELREDHPTDEYMTIQTTKTVLDFIEERTCS